jgi:hypothetical protein
MATPLKTISDVYSRLRISSEHPEMWFNTVSDTAEIELIEYVLKSEAARWDGEECDIGFI